MITKLPPLHFATFPCFCTCLQFSTDTNDSMNQWVTTINLLSGLQSKGKYRILYLSPMRAGNLNVIEDIRALLIFAKSNVFMCNDLI